MATLDSIKAEMRDLSGDDLAKIRDYANLLLNSGTGTSASPDGPANQMVDLILETLCELMRAKAADFSSPQMLRASQYFKPFVAKVDGELGAYLKRVVSGNRIALRALLYLCLELLYDNLTEMSVPVTSRTMMAHIHRLPAVLNKSFPGYAAAGLLSMIIRKEDGTCLDRIKS